MASTFWKKTIHGAISCVQPTRFDSSSCSLKLPAVWKNFRGTSGARRRTSASACRGPASSAPPRSKYSRIEPAASSTTSSPSTRPILPPSNVTSLISSETVASAPAASHLLVRVGDPRRELLVELRLVFDAEVVDEEVALIRRGGADARVLDLARDVEVADQPVALRP